MHLYNFCGKEAEILKEKINAVILEKSMTLSEIDSSFLTMQELVTDLKRLFHQNVFLSMIGIYDGKDKSGVFSEFIDSFFICKFLNSFIPMGYYKYINRVHLDENQFAGGERVNPN